MKPKPIYMTAKQLALEIGINPNGIHKTIKRWRTRHDNPCPKPDAYFTFEHGVMPLWLIERLPEWREWQTKRQAIVEELQAQERANAARNQLLEELM